MAMLVRVRAEKTKSLDSLPHDLPEISSYTMDEEGFLHVSASSTRASRAAVILHFHPKDVS